MRNRAIVHTSAAAFLAIRHNVQTVFTGAAGMVAPKELVDVFSGMAGLFPGVYSMFVITSTDTGIEIDGIDY